MLPQGVNGPLNADGVCFYNGILDELEKYGIKPIVILYHWDHPQQIEDLGGWLSNNMVKTFATYARRMFEIFAPHLSSRSHRFAKNEEISASTDLFEMLK